MKFMPELSKQQEVFWCLYLCTKPWPFISTSLHHPATYTSLFLSPLSLKSLKSWPHDGVPRIWKERYKKALSDWTVGVRREGTRKRIACQPHYVYGERVLPFAVCGMLSRPLQSSAIFPSNDSPFSCTVKKNLVSIKKRRQRVISL